jgi:stage II sporulation protein D
MSSVKLTDVSFTVGSGSYLLQADTVFIDTLKMTETMRFRSVGGELTCSVVDSFVIAKEIKLIPIEENGFFDVKGNAASSKVHSYYGSLYMTVKNGKISLINEVSMERYLGGVIESEGGGGQHLEYYKVQAVMSRSYALKNKDRHKKEGFELCDAVHCQAYHNRCRNESLIEKAVEQTKGEVLIDAKGEIITAYFYANCGGQTSAASYVWNSDVPYCQPFIDTFCIHKRQAKWEKRIARTEWENYISKEFGIDLKDSNLFYFAYHFKQEQRKAFYIHPSLGIPLRDLRSEFNLKSTFFDVLLEGNEVVLKGRGFGHGVGLCQEGAMEMAKKGYNYAQISIYYFENVKLRKDGGSIE